MTKELSKVMQRHTINRFHLLLRTTAKACREKGNKMKRVEKYIHSPKIMTSACRVWHTQDAYSSDLVRRGCSLLSPPFFFQSVFKHSVPSLLPAAIGKALYQHRERRGNVRALTDCAAGDPRGGAEHTKETCGFLGRLSGWEG